MIRNAERVKKKSGKCFATGQALVDLPSGLRGTTVNAGFTAQIARSILSPRASKKISVPVVSANAETEDRSL